LHANNDVTTRINKSSRDDHIRKLSLERDNCNVVSGLAASTVNDHELPVRCIGLLQYYVTLSVGMCGIDFLNFCSVSVRFLKKNSFSVRNEFGSVRFKTRGSLGYYSYLPLM